MHVITKMHIVTLLQDACYILTDVVDKSQDELHALDELGEVLGHIKDVEAEGE